MIFSRVVYDTQFSFVTIYKVGKCMMPSVLKICSDFKSRVVYSSLNTARAADEVNKNNFTLKIAFCKKNVRH